MFCRLIEVILVVKKNAYKNIDKIIIPTYNNIYNLSAECLM